MSAQGNAKAVISTAMQVKHTYVKLDLGGDRKNKLFKKIKNNVYLFCVNK